MEDISLVKINNTQKEFENREALLLEALDNIRQKSLSELYETEKSVSEIIRDIVDIELLDLEINNKK